jgi:hypothetical protein
MAASSGIVGVLVIVLFDFLLRDKFHINAVRFSDDVLYLISLVLGALPALFILNRLLAWLHYPLFEKNVRGFPIVRENEQDNEGNDTDADHSKRL